MRLDELVPNLVAALIHVQLVFEEQLSARHPVLTEHRCPDIDEDLPLALRDLFPDEAVRFDPKGFSQRRAVV